MFNDRYMETELFRDMKLYMTLLSLSSVEHEHNKTVLTDQWKMFRGVAVMVSIITMC